MKILHVVQGYPPAMGGTEEAFAYLSEHLARLFGDEVTVLTTNCYGGDAFNRFGLPRMAAGEELINGVHIRRFRVLAWLSWLFKGPQYLAAKLNFRFSQHLKTLYQGPLVPGLSRAIRHSEVDLVVASSFPLMHMYAALRAARQSHKPLIFVGGLHPEDAWSFDRPMIYKALQKADACIAYTQYEADYMIAKGVPAAKVHVIGLGVDTAVDTQDSISFPKPDADTPRCPVVGYVGQVSAHKGVDQLIYAMKLVWQRYPDVQLLIAGARRPYAEKVDQLLASLPLSQQKQFKLRYDFNENERSFLYDALDVFVYPSRYESFGIAFLEAWRSHKPIIGLRTGAIPCVVDDQVNGLLVEPGDIDALANAIFDLLEHPAKARIMAEKGYQKVLAEYTWNRVTGDFRKVYQQVLEEQHGKPG